MEEHLIDKTSARLDTLERLIEQRFKSGDEALKVALAANESRLEGMNEFRGSITELTTKMITRVEALNVLEATARKTDADVEMLRERMEIAARPNYPLMIGFMSMVATLVTGIWLIVGLKIDTSVAPIDNRLISLETRNTTLTTNMSTAYERIASIRTDVAKVTAAEAEIETQFCASDIVRNLMHATDMRVLSMLWSKALKDEHYPIENAYYPQICNRPASNTNSN